MVSAISEGRTFVAVLLHDQRERDVPIELPRSEQSVPPTRIRMQASFEGAAAYDVHELVGAQEWPDQAVYQHVAVEPRSEPDRP